MNCFKASTGRVEEPHTHTSPSCFSHHLSGNLNKRVTFTSRVLKCWQVNCISWTVHLNNTHTCIFHFLRVYLMQSFSYHLNFTLGLRGGTCRPTGILISRCCKCAPFPFIAAVSYIVLFGRHCSTVWCGSGWCWRKKKQFTASKNPCEREKKMEICKI